MDEKRRSCLLRLILEGSNASSAVAIDLHSSLFDDKSVTAWKEITIYERIQVTNFLSCLNVNENIAILKQA